MQRACKWGEITRAHGIVLDANSRLGLRISVGRDTAFAGPRRISLEESYFGFLDERGCRWVLSRSRFLPLRFGSRKTRQTRCCSCCLHVKNHSGHCSVVPLMTLVPVQLTRAPSVAIGQLPNKGTHAHTLQIIKATKQDPENNDGRDDDRAHQKTKENTKDPSQPVVSGDIMGRMRCTKNAENK